MFSTPTRRLLFLALTTLASAMWLGGGGGALC